MNKLKSAIIGCGFIAGLYDDIKDKKNILTHAKAYLMHPNIELIAAVDTNEENLKKFQKKYKISYIFNTASEMLEKIKPDIISICSPSQTHDNYLNLISKYNIKGIWCEKPFGLDYKKVKQNFKISINRNIYINHFRRWSIGIEYIRNIINNKILGNLKRIIFYHSKGIMTNGSHAIDLLLFLIGVLPIKIKLIKIHKIDVNDSVVDVLLDYQDFQVYIFENLNLDYSFFEMDIIFEKGRITTKNNGFDIYLYKTKRSNYYKNYYWLSAKGKKIKNNLNRAMYKILDTLYNNIISKKVNNFLIDEYNNYLICNKIYKLALKG